MKEKEKNIYGIFAVCQDPNSVTRNRHFAENKRASRALRGGMRKRKCRACKQQRPQKGGERGRSTTDATGGHAT
jgi:hypothetical protein